MMSFAEHSEAARRVLIAEGHQATELQLAELLATQGYQVSSTPNGRLALEMARRERPQLIICDVAMPEMSGYELCAWVKNDAKLADVPVMLVAPPADPREFIRAVECRADALLLRPVDVGQVLRRLRSLLRGRHASPAASEMAIEYEFNGQRYTIDAGRPQILELLMASVETLLIRTRELEQSIENLRRPPAIGKFPGGGITPQVARSLRVLLIDDDSALLESLRSALQDEGHKVTAAAGGQPGIDAFREAQRAGKLFDVVITDLAMPFIDGRQVVSCLRELSPGTPIILLTGWGQQVAAEKGPTLQVDRVLGKPPRMRELRAVLQELTGRRVTDRPG